MVAADIDPALWEASYRDPRVTTVAAIETPAQRDKREAAARQADTEASIKCDPFVLAAQDIFDAEIVPDSIRRLD